MNNVFCLLGKQMHKACFVCASCNQPFVEFIKFYWNIHGIHWNLLYVFWSTVIVAIRCKFLHPPFERSFSKRRIILSHSTWASDFDNLKTYIRYIESFNNLWWGVVVLVLNEASVGLIIFLFYQKTDNITAASSSV